MDVSEVEDIGQLKALAYDETRQIAMHQRNLQVLEERISQLEQDATEQPSVVSQ